MLLPTQIIIYTQFMCPCNNLLIFRIIWFEMNHQQSNNGHQASNIFQTTLIIISWQNIIQQSLNRIKVKKKGLRQWQEWTYEENLLFLLLLKVNDNDVTIRKSAERKKKGNSRSLKKQFSIITLSQLSDFIVSSKNGQEYKNLYKIQQNNA